MEKARSFATLILESVRGHPGIEASVCAFDDDTVYDLGRPGGTAIGGLTPGGGNNDAAGLLYAARQALRSGKERKLLVMISDGYPTECSFESLRRLVDLLLSNYGICSAQVAVASMDPDRVAFPDFVDLTEHSMAAAVAEFGRMLQRVLRRRFGL